MRTIFACTGALLGAAVAGAFGLVGPSGYIWAAAAWLAVAAVAAAYRLVAGPPAAAALALLGVVASAWTVQAALRLSSGVPLALASGFGLAVFAYALWRGRLLSPVAGVLIGIAALSGALTTDPGMPYVLGGFPLGVALLAAAHRPEWEHVMRTVYRVFAYAVAVEVAVQAALVALAISGLTHWVEGGHVFEKSVMEDQGGPLPFPEVIGIILHGLNGGAVIPLVALILLVLSFFTKLPGGVKWAAIVLVLVAVQVTLGYAAHGLPSLGGLHGLNALLLFAAALHAGNRARRPKPAEQSDVDAPARVAA